MSKIVKYLTIGAVLATLAPAIAFAPRAVAEKLVRDPPKLPIGVRLAETIYTSFIKTLPFEATKLNNRTLNKFSFAGSPVQKADRMKIILCLQPDLGL